MHFPEGLENTPFNGLTIWQDMDMVTKLFIYQRQKYAHKIQCPFKKYAHSNDCEAFNVFGFSKICLNRK